MGTELKIDWKEPAMYLKRIAVKFVTAMLWALAIVVLYDWFIEPVFNIGQISALQLLGVVLFIRLCLCIFQPSEAKKNAEDKKEAVEYYTIRELVKAESKQWLSFLVFVFMAWLVHLGIG